MDVDGQPIACRPDAIPPDQRERYTWLRQQLQPGIEGVEESVNGYGLRLAKNIVPVAAEFIMLERLCCPFLRFNLEITDSLVTLWLTGGDGVKAFLKQEMALES